MPILERFKCEKKLYDGSLPCGQKALICLLLGEGVVCGVWRLVWCVRFLSVDYFYCSIWCQIVCLCRNTGIPACLPVVTSAGTWNVVGWGAGRSAGASCLLWEGAKIIAFEGTAAPFALCCCVPSPSPPCVLAPASVDSALACWSWHALLSCSDSEPLPGSWRGSGACGRLKPQGPPSATEVLELMHLYPRIVIPKSHSERHSVWLLKGLQAGAQLWPAPCVFHRPPPFLPSLSPPARSLPDVTAVKSSLHPTHASCSVFGGTHVQKLSPRDCSEMILWSD